MTETSDPATSLDAETLAFAGRMFELARNGDQTALTEQVDAGLPVNLTNDKGDPLGDRDLLRAAPDVRSAPASSGVTRPG